MALQEQEWRRRHLRVCAVLALLAVVVPVAAVPPAPGPLGPIGCAVALVVPLAVALLDDARRYLRDDPALAALLPRWVRGSAATAGLLVACGEVARLSGGAAWSAWAPFLVVGVVTLYEAWTPVLLVVAGVAAQHGVDVLAGAGPVPPATVLHVVAVAAAALVAVWSRRVGQASRHREAVLVEELRHRVLHDPVTGVANRAALQVRLEDALAGDDDVAVVVLALDATRPAEDALREAAGRLAGALREEDLVARLAGATFGVVLPGASAPVALAVARRLREACGGEVGAGVAVRPGASRDAGRSTVRQAEDLLQRAADAQRCARRDGTGLAAHPGPDAAGGVDATLAELRTALAEPLDRPDRQVVVHYQPKVDLVSGATTGVEALVRWAHPRRGTLPPAEFVPLAERSGLAEALTRTVLEVALRDAAGWAATGLVLPVAVNVSARCLRPELVDVVGELLERHGVAASGLRLEVTDAVLGLDPAVAVATLVALRQHGVRVSLDDVGGGLSSLATLRALPVDEVKVDRAFVLGLVAEDPLAREADLVLVRAVVQVAHASSLTVVAEGVETAEVAAAARAAGCDVGQGFHFSHPVTAQALPAAVRGVPARAVG